MICFGVGQNGRDEVAERQFTMDFHNAGVHVSDFERWWPNQCDYLLQWVATVFSRPMSLSAGGSLFYNNVRSGQFARTWFRAGCPTQLQLYPLQGTVSFLPLALCIETGDGHLVSDERLALENVSASWAVGYEYRWNQRHSFVLESLNYQGWATNDPDFSGAIEWGGCGGIVIVCIALL